MGSKPFSLEEFEAVAKASYKPHKAYSKSIDTLKPIILNCVKHMSENGYIFEKMAYAALCSYCMGYSLLLSGDCGIGKTHFFECLDDNIVILDMGNLVRYDFDELTSTLQTYHDREVVIDDIGVGTKDGRDYGQRFDTLLTILNTRKKCAKRTHFTTNLTESQLREFYDKRAYDRIKGMAKMYHFERTESYRRASIS